MSGDGTAFDTAYDEVLRHWPVEANDTDVPSRGAVS